MYLVTGSTAVTKPTAVGDADPRDVALVAVALGAVGWAAWQLLFARKRKLHGPGCRIGAGPRLKRVNRITNRGGMTCRV